MNKMAFQNLIMAVCFVTVVLMINSKATCRPLHMGIMKRQAETRVNATTILEQITIESLKLFRNVRHYIKYDMQAIIIITVCVAFSLQSKLPRTGRRTYQLIPVNDTELLSVLTEEPLELDQLRLLCDVMAMEESVRLLNGANHSIDIGTIISEEVGNLQPIKSITV